jgi:hypothetical protein
MLDNQLPAPPVDMVMPFANDVYSIATLVSLALFAAWTIYQCFRDKSPILLLILIGGVLCFLQEPIMDHVGAVWYPYINQSFTVFRAFNVSVPLWVVPGYGLFVGAVSVVLYRKMMAGMTATQLWKFYFVVWLLDLLLELPGLNLGTYIYFGHAALSVFGFPMTWAMTNTCIVFLTAALLVSFKDFFVGPKLLLIPVVVTMANGAAQASAGYPVWLTLNSGADSVLKLFAAIVTLGMSLLIVHGISLKVAIKQK